MCLRTHRVQVGILRAGTEQGKTYASFTMLVLLGHEGAADEVGCGPSGCVPLRLPAKHWT